MSRMVAQQPTLLDLFRVKCLERLALSAHLLKRSPFDPKSIENDPNGEPNGCFSDVRHSLPAV